MIMKFKIQTILLLTLLFCSNLQAQLPDSIKKYRGIIKEHIDKDYKSMFRPAEGVLKYPYITPGSDAYANDLWDWDSWLSDIALQQIVADAGKESDSKEAIVYGQGCVLNFLTFAESDGYIPIVIWKAVNPRTQMPADIYKANMHKPVLAQHAAFITLQSNGSAEWIREKFNLLQSFMNNYAAFHRHKATGLYYWQNDMAIGGDNDPCTFYRPAGSSASIFLNCMMFKELKAMVYLANCLNLKAIGDEYEEMAENLKTSIQKNCWDERDGFFYSVDINLLPVTSEPTINLGLKFSLHSGFPRNYDCLIQRIGVWSGFLAMWSGIATPEQAKRMVNEHLKNEKTFGAPYGVRTLSKMEKMYSVRASGNPSNWLGPIWGISNYMVFKGLTKYGFDKEARGMVFKTIKLFGRDFEKNGALHEYYEPEEGEPVLHKGFQDWNYLVINMIAWLDGKKVVEEF